MKVKMGGKSRDIPAVWWEDGKVLAIDQTRLPNSLKILKISDHREVAKAIKTMAIRGAPTIGATAAYGLALAWKNGESVKRADKLLRSARPTANDLFFALDWMLERMEDPIESAREYSLSIVSQCEKIGERGARLIKDGMTVLTHCNAGALATVDFGTALAPIRIAHRRGKSLTVLVDETRPRLQGAKLTSWELLNEGIDHAIITDNAAGHFLKSEVNLVIVGADRIAKNGDAGNKIGTYEKAVVAKENGVPFYVAAPVSTFDPGIPNGEQIPIEERAPSEVLRIGKEMIGPAGAVARNPAFDVTPAKYITGFITEKGIRKPSEIAGLIGKK